MLFKTSIGENAMERPITVGFFSAGIADAYDPAVGEANHIAAAKKMNTLSKKLGFKLVSADGVMTNRHSLQPFLNRCAAEQADLIVLHAASFTAGEVGQQLASYLIQHLTPVVVWGVPEAAGGSLQANSFGCVNLMANILQSMNIPFKWLYAAPNDRKFVDGLTQTVRVVDTIKYLRSSTVGVIGSGRAPGLHGSNIDETALKSRYGMSVELVDLSALYQTMGVTSKESAAQAASEVAAGCAKCEGTPEEMEKSMRAYLGLRSIALERGYAGMAMRCRPEMRTDTGAEMCLPMALLSDDGIPCACEADVPGLLSMMIQFRLTGGEPPPTLLDMVGVDDMRNTITLWRCGVSAPSLMRGSGVSIRPHSLIEQNSPALPRGLVAEGTLDPGAATLLRIHGHDGGSYLAVEGEILKAKSPYRGSHADFHPANLWIMDFINTALTQGVAHHYSISPTYHLDDIEEFAYWLGIHAVGMVPYNDGQGAFGMT